MWVLKCQVSKTPILTRGWMSSGWDSFAKAVQAAAPCNAHPEHIPDKGHQEGALVLPCKA